MTKIKLGEIELRDDRLILIKRFRDDLMEVDITAVWHFFKEVQAYLRKPKS